MYQVNYFVQQINIDIYIYLNFCKYFMELKFFRLRYGHFWENMDNVLILLLFHSRESSFVFTSDLMVKLPVLILKHVSLFDLFNVQFANFNKLILSNE